MACCRNPAACQARCQESGSYHVCIRRPSSPKSRVKKNLVYAPLLAMKLANSMEVQSHPKLSCDRYVPAKIWISGATWAGGSNSRSRALLSSTFLRAPNAPHSGEIGTGRPHMGLQNIEDHLRQAQFRRKLRKSD